MNSTELLKCAREKVSRYWIKGGFGTSGTKAKPRCCALGAIGWCADPDAFTGTDPGLQCPEATEAIERLARAINNPSPSPYITQPIVVGRFNDKASTKLEDILAAFDRAIEAES